VFTDRDTNEDSEIGGKGIISKNYSASVGLNYTLFDGLGRKYNYKQLKETYNLTELQAKQTIENTYLQLFTSYYQIARLTATTLNLNETLTISKNRLKRANYAYDYGQNTKLDVVNAVVDVNNDSIALINSKQQLLNAKRGLLLVLGTKKDINFNVETEVDFLTILNLEDLKQKTLANNSVLNQTKKILLLQSLM
jgi:Outer membrane protein